MNKKNIATLEQIAIKLVQEKKPNNVQQLISLMKSESLAFSETEIMQCLLQLEDQGKLKLVDSGILSTPNLRTYLKMEKNIWYWGCIIIATVATLTVFGIHDNSNPLMIIRNILGSVFILFLPGYSLIKLLFPNKEIDNIKRTALSFGMSLGIVPITGLMLYYTQWGVQTEIITMFLFIITFLFSTAAILRQYYEKAK